jgi:phage replication O-like protein O
MRKIERPNFTQVPNVIFDYWGYHLTPKAFRVLLYLCRKTFGWNKTSDTISLNQLAKTTSLSKSTLTLAIKELEEKELIIKKHRSNQYGNQPNSYAINVYKPEDANSDPEPNIYSDPIEHDQKRQDMRWSSEPEMYSDPIEHDQPKQDEKRHEERYEKRYEKRYETRVYPSSKIGCRRGRKSAIGGCEKRSRTKEIPTKERKENKIKEKNARGASATAGAAAVCVGFEKENEKKNRYGEDGIVQLTRSEYDKLVKTIGKDMTDSLIEDLNNYIGSTGKKYHSHYYTIKTWSRKRIAQGNTPNLPEENKKYAEEVAANLNPVKCKQRHCRIEVLNKHFEIVPLGTSQTPTCIQFSDGGFKEQMNNALRKWRLIP